MDYATVRNILIGVLLSGIATAISPVLAADDAQTRTSSQQDPDKLVDRPGEKPMMGYGTEGIADDAKNPSLGNRSMLGAPEKDALAGFDEMDTDGNGALTQTEAEAIDSEQWQQIDADGNGEIDRSEFAAFEQTSGSETE